MPDELNILYLLNMSADIRIPNFTFLEIFFLPSNDVTVRKMTPKSG